MIDLSELHGATAVQTPGGWLELPANVTIEVVRWYGGQQFPAIVMEDGTTTTIVPLASVLAVRGTFGGYRHPAADLDLTPVGHSRSTVNADSQSGLARGPAANPARVQAAR